MKKYILNGIIWNEYNPNGNEDLFVAPGFSFEASEQDLIKLGATEVKDDEWIELQDLNTPSGGFFGEYCKNSALFEDRKCKQDGKMYEGGVSCSCFDGSEDKENSIVHKVNQLIKNQQYLKRRVDAQKKNE